MSRVLPILFNTEMVHAILDGRKTATRRCVRGDVVGILNSQYHKEHPEVSDKMLLKKLCKAPCCTGDVLYIRETWSFLPCVECMSEGPACSIDPVVYDDGDSESEGCFVYKASHPRPEKVSWTPSIHMPKQAARIWLKVTDVRVERLQDIDVLDCQREGIDISQNAIFKRFSTLWDSTIKEKDIYRYGWKSNPWVWAIEFERCEKPVVS